MLWLAQDYDYLHIIPSLIIGVCKEKTQSAASPNNVCVVSRSETLETYPYSFQEVQSEDRL